MKPWLEGDFSGVDTRASAADIRNAVIAAVHRGEDPGRLIRALAAKDPHGCAELVAGPRALAHHAVVSAAITAAAALEAVVDAEGLHARWIDLAPDLAAEVIAAAAARHPAEEWVVRLSRQHDPEPGAIHLAAAARTGRLLEACRMYAALGVLDGLLARARTGAVEPLAALYAAGRLEPALDAAALALDADPDAPVVPALAAVHGPELAGLLKSLLPRVSTIPAQERVRWALVDVAG